MKNALAIHDLSCYSKSSLTVVLPLLEAAGVECSLLPTAILSTQSDGFDELASTECTSSCERIISVWKKLGICFDAVYSGYLATSKQSQLVENAIDAFSKDDSIILVDPVLGDGLSLYQGLTDEHILQMTSLITKATLITPNWTEAQLLVDRKALFESTTLEKAKRYAERLYEISGALIVITSVPVTLGSVVNLAYDGKEARYFSNDALSPSLPGCGDMFASILLSLLLDDFSFFTAVRKAGEVTTEALRYSLSCGRERRMGVMLKTAIRELALSSHL